MVVISESLICKPVQDFDCKDWELLCSKLSALATDCNKHRAKNDKRKQRSVFRDVLKAVQVRNWCREHFMNTKVLLMRHGDLKELFCMSAGWRV